MSIADRWLACALVAATSLACSIAARALRGPSLPHSHDDYAYLLAADTFAHGRLANPPHPLAAHFETMHVLQSPKYVAKFPPGQGVVLVPGLVGAWLVCAAACAAIWWALRIWFTPSQALLGGMLAAIHPTMLVWSSTFHGGGIAALAGAMLLGALASSPAGQAASRRLAGGTPAGQPAGRRRAELAGIAIALFAYSRPYEGLVFTIAVLLILRPRPLVRIGVVALLGLVPLGIYNYGITGNPFVLPYTVYEHRYDPTPNFLWESPRRVAPEPNLEMATVYRDFYAGHWTRIHERMDLEVHAKLQVIGYAIFGRPETWLWWLLFVPLLAIPWALQQRRARLLSSVLLLFAFAPFSIVWWMQMHYLAPVTVVVVALAVMLLKELRVGAIVVVAAFAINSGANFVKYVRSRDPGNEPARQEIARRVGPGKHLIVVAPDAFDFVYNGADIDGQRVVWARDLGDNRALLAYYRDRRAWRVRALDCAVALEPY